MGKLLAGSTRLLDLFRFSTIVTVFFKKFEVFQSKNMEDIKMSKKLISMGML